MKQDKSLLVRPSLWYQLKQAIKGTEADYTKIRLSKAIFLLGVPMILELLMESAFAVVDIYFVGKLGASAVATVGLTETYLYLLYAIGMGLSLAVTAIVARRTGEKKVQQAGEAAVQSIFFAILAAVPFALAGILFPKQLLTWMGADTWAIEQGYIYTQWMLGGNVVIMLLFVVNAVFRGAGDASVAMWVLLFSNALNMILDPLLIFGWGPFPAMGLEGAALATNIGRGAGVLLQFWVLFRGGKHIRILLEQIRWNHKAMAAILRTSLGGMAQMIIAMTSWIFLVRILAYVGSEAVAGATIALRIMMFTMMPAFGLSNAAATLVGQNLGAEDPARAESSVWKIGNYTMVFLIGVSFFYFFYSEPLMRIFSEDEEVVQIGAQWLRISSYSYFIYAWWMVTTQAFNGAGDTRTPTIINLVFFWVLQLPLAYFLALEFDLQHLGVFWSVFASEALAGIYTLWLFSRGRWKRMKI